jgi:hypothetical protein
MATGFFVTSGKNEPAWLPEHPAEADLNLRTRGISLAGIFLVATMKSSLCIDSHFVDEDARCVFSDIPHHKNVCLVLWQSCDSNGVPDEFASIRFASLDRRQYDPRHVRGRVSECRLQPSILVDPFVELCDIGRGLRQQGGRKNCKQRENPKHDGHSCTDSAIRTGKADSKPDRINKLNTKLHGSLGCSYG